MKARLALLYVLNRTDRQDHIVKSFGVGLYAELRVMDFNLDDGSKRSVLKNDIIIVKIEKMPKRKTFLMGKDKEVKGLGKAVASIRTF